jgi:acyl-CoA thioester hydrolase
MTDHARFSYPHRVTYAECTLGNHIYYGRYLEILEAARGEFFRQLGTPFLALQKGDTLFPVIECRLSYRAAAAYDDLLTVELWITLARGVRLRFAYRLLNESRAVVLEAETGHACTNLHNKPKRLPAELCAALEPYINDIGPTFPTPRTTLPS